MHQYAEREGIASVVDRSAHVCYIAVVAYSLHICLDARIHLQVYHALKSVIKAKYGQDACNVGDEGGFAPNIGSNREGAELLLEACKKSGHLDKVCIQHSGYMQHPLHTEYICSNLNKMRCRAFTTRIVSHLDKVCMYPGQ